MERATSRIRRGTLSDPDSRRELPRSVGWLTRIGPLELGRAILAPGWRWSDDVKPIVGTDWCQIHHLQVLLRGRLGIRMADGEEATFEPGDAFELPPGHDAWVIGDDPAELLDIYGNVGDFGLPASPERVLATVLLTDIVDSTGTAERLGDSAWSQVLANHNRVIRSNLARYHGREVNTTGDGFLATFASPVAAVRCAAAIRDACAEIGVPVRIGVHTGEIEERPEDVGGIAVHATARIATLAGPSDVLVSGVTRGLVEGNGLPFEPLGQHDLKGFEAPMELFRLLR